MNKYNYKFGKLGEQIAEKYLRKNNYNLLEKNFYCKQGEIDIIAEEKSKQEIVFIEVKTRGTLKYGLPKEAVTETKRKHMYRSSKYYLYKTNRLDNFVRFDVIEVIIKGGKCMVNHIKNIEI